MSAWVLLFSTYSTFAPFYVSFTVILFVDVRYLASLLPFCIFEQSELTRLVVCVCMCVHVCVCVFFFFKFKYQDSFCTVPPAPVAIKPARNFASRLFTLTSEYYFISLNCKQMQLFCACSSRILRSKNNNWRYYIKYKLVQCSLLVEQNI